MAKIVQMHALSITAALLAATSPAAPAGQVHVTAQRMIEDDQEPGATYARVGESTDVLVSDPEIGQKARELWALCAAKLADDARAPVRTRDGDPLVQPTAR